MPLIILAIVASTLLGIWAERRWSGRAGHGSRQALLGILYFVLPPVIVINLAKADFTVGAGVGLALALVTVCTVGAVAWFLSVRVLDLPRPVAGAVIATSVTANSSYLGFPMVLALMGGDDLSQAVVYDVVVSGTSLTLIAFGVGAAFGTKAGQGIRERTKAFFFRNPLIYAGLLGVLAPEAVAPTLLVEITWVMAAMILPVGFFAVGAVLAEEERIGAIRLPPRVHRQIGVVIFAKLVVSPALLFVLAMPFSGIPHSYYLLAAMPSGLNSMIVAHAYGLDLRTTAEALVYTTAIVVIGATAWTLML
jgi:predicted permease